MPKAPSEPRKLIALVFCRLKQGSNGIPRSEAHTLSPFTFSVPAGIAIKRTPPLDERIVRHLTMMMGVFCGASGLALLLASLALVHVPAQTTQMGVDEIRPGMIGVGRTVFEGTRVEEFKVHILGVSEAAGVNALVGLMARESLNANSANIYCEPTGRPAALISWACAAQPPALPLPRAPEPTAIPTCGCAYSDPAIPSQDISARMA